MLCAKLARFLSSVSHLCKKRVTQGSDATFPQALTVSGRIPKQAGGLCLRATPMSYGLLWGIVAFFFLGFQGTQLPLQASSMGGSGRFLQQLAEASLGNWPLAPVCNPVQYAEHNPKQQFKTERGGVETSGPCRETMACAWFCAWFPLLQDRPPKRTRRVCSPPRPSS